MAELIYQRLGSSEALVTSENRCLLDVGALVTRKIQTHFLGLAQPGEKLLQLAT